MHVALDPVVLLERTQQAAQPHVQTGSIRGTACTVKSWKEHKCRRDWYILKHSHTGRQPDVYDKEQPPSYEKPTQKVRGGVYGMPPHGWKSCTRGLFLERHKNQGGGCVYLTRLKNR